MIRGNTLTVLQSIYWKKSAYKWIGTVQTYGAQLYIPLHLRSKDIVINNPWVKK